MYEKEEKAEIGFVDCLNSATLENLKTGVSSPPRRKVNLFSPVRLGRRLWCADNPKKNPLRIKNCEDALRHSDVQANSAFMIYRIVFDLDLPNSALAAKAAGLPPTNWISVKSENGHAHVGYEILGPVCISAKGRKAPIRYLAAIAARYREKIGGDKSYSGLTCKNPNHPAWETTVEREEAYTLDELASYVDMTTPLTQKQLCTTSLGRNVTLFDRLRKWAYAQKRNYETAEAFAAACRAHAVVFNKFDVTLSLGECEQVARSVAKWTWKSFDVAESDLKFSKVQRRRGAGSAQKAGLASGVTRATRADQRRKEIEALISAGRTTLEIMSSLKVSKKTIYRANSKSGHERHNQITPGCPFLPVSVPFPPSLNHKYGLSLAPPCGGPPLPVSPDSLLSSPGCLVRGGVAEGHGITPLTPASPVPALGSVAAEFLRRALARNASRSVPAVVLAPEFLPAVVPAPFFEPVIDIIKIDAPEAPTALVFDLKLRDTPLNVSALTKLLGRLRDVRVTHPDRVEAIYAKTTAFFLKAMDSGTLPQHYKEADSGRLYAVGLNLQNAEKSIKAACLKGFPEYDFSNCHFAILLQMSEKHGLKCPAIVNYVATKQASRIAIANSARITIKEAKIALIAVMYGAKASARADLAIAEHIGVEAATRLLENEQFSAIAAEVAQARAVIVKNWPKNQDGSITNACGKTIDSSASKLQQLAHVIQGVEAKALRTVIDMHRDELLLLQHDGFVSIRKLDVQAISAAVLEATGFKLELEEERIRVLED